MIRTKKESTRATSTKRESLISKDLILLKNNLIGLPTKLGARNNATIGTILSNLAYYGYTLSKDGFEQLIKIDMFELSSWWKTIDNSLAEITGDNRKIDNFVVYKNFPSEVLNMSESEYWINQICMYIGFPNDLFTTPALKREPLNDKLSLKVLHLANDNSLNKILTELLALPNKWTDEQYNFIINLIVNEELKFDLTKIPFKENLIKLISLLIKSNIEVKLKSATDVIRFAIGLSDGDISMKTNSKLRKFNRSERQFLLGLLETTTNLTEDMARDTGRWKKLMYALHPGDYKNKYPNVVKAYDSLYHDDVETFNAKVERYLLSKDIKVFDLLKSRPGEFTRRLFKTIEVFGIQAVTNFSDVMKNLTVIQLLKIRRQVETVNGKKFRTIAPKGNWTKLQILPNSTKLNTNAETILIDKLNTQISLKVSKLVPKVNLADGADLIKLQTNDGELASYGRGTVFPIPNNIKFIRSASYWQAKAIDYNNIWFDNGWNFFDENWNTLGTCSWDTGRFGNNSSIFSGDPTNSKEMEGKACQMIDLYLDKLDKEGVRYAVWNILAYSNIKFSDATDVFAALQWGEEAQTGKLFEPSRCQLSFPLKGNNLTKYIAYIDIKERKLVYLDANLKGNVRSASTNGNTLQTVMPAVVEYLDTLPSVHDLFDMVDTSEEGTFIGYSDENVTLKDGEEAYVFKSLNENNNFTQLDLTKILNSI